MPGLERAAHGARSVVLAVLGRVQAVVMHTLTGMWGRVVGGTGPMLAVELADGSRRLWLAVCCVWEEGQFAR